MAATARPRQASRAPAARAGAPVGKERRRAPPFAQSGSYAMAPRPRALLSRHKRVASRARPRRGSNRACPRAWLRFTCKGDGAGRGSRGPRPETGRQRQPQTKARASRAIGPIEHFDSAAVRERVFSRDSQAQTRPFDSASRRNLALVERLKYPRPLVRIDARTLVDDIEHRKIAFNRKVELDRRRARRVFDSVRQQIVDHGPDFIAVADDDRRRKRRLESEQSREGG